LSQQPINRSPESLSAWHPQTRWWTVHPNQGGRWNRGVLARVAARRLPVGNFTRSGERLFQLAKSRMSPRQRVAQGEPSCDSTGTWRRTRPVVWRLHAAVGNMRGMIDAYRKRGTGASRTRRPRPSVQRRTSFTGAPENGCPANTPAQTRNNAEHWATQINDGKYIPDPTGELEPGPRGAER